MSNFIYNNKLIDGKIGIQELMVKFLENKFGNVSKIISEAEFFEALKTANFTLSLDNAILVLKQYGINLQNETTLNEVKQYLVKCLEKSILVANKQVKESKINSASYYREAQAINQKGIIEGAVNLRSLFGSFDYLVNYLTNAVLSAELIYTAENNAIKTLRTKNQSLENETLQAVDTYVKVNLNLGNILTTSNPKEIEALLKNYNNQRSTIQTTKKPWKFQGFFLN